MHEGDECRTIEAMQWDAECTCVSPHVQLHVYKERESGAVTCIPSSHRHTMNSSAKTIVLFLSVLCMTPRPLEADMLLNVVEDGGHVKSVVKDTLFAATTTTTSTTSSTTVTEGTIAPISSHAAQKVASSPETTPSPTLAPTITTTVTSPTTNATTTTAATEDVGEDSTDVTVPRDEDSKGEFEEMGGEKKDEKKNDDMQMAQTNGTSSTATNTSLTPEPQVAGASGSSGRLTTSFCLLFFLVCMSLFVRM